MSARAKRGHWARAAVAAGLLGLLPVSGCHCGKKSDEEILRERIDTTSVYLYVASKIAVTKADGSPEVAAARKELFAVIEVLGKAAAAHHAASLASSGSATPASSTVPAALPVGTAAPVAPAAPKLEAADYAKLAKALWGLRSEGQEIVRSGREDQLAPILPVLLADSPENKEVIAVLDVNTEHALFLTGFFALKFHPKSPVPLPEEILLYEAWSTHSDKVRLEGMAPLVQAMKATVYGMNALCDLAAQEGALAEAAKDDPAAMSASFRKMSGNRAQLDKEQAVLVNAAARALAHGAAGKCYLDRDEREKALVEIEKFIDAAHLLGVPQRETALLRAYLAYERDDHDTARKALEEARNDPQTDPETRKELEEMLGHVAKNDDDAIRKYFGKRYFQVAAVRLLWNRLDRAGVIDAVKDTAVAAALYGFMHVTAGALGSTSSMPSLDGAKEQGQGIWKRIKG